jgi:hypothetical protein
MKIAIRSWPPTIATCSRGSRSRCATGSPEGEGETLASARTLMTRAYARRSAADVDLRPFEGSVAA